MKLDYICMVFQINKTCPTLPPNHLRTGKLTSLKGLKTKQLVPKPLQNLGTNIGVLYLFIEELMNF